MYRRVTFAAALAAGIIAAPAAGKISVQPGLYETASKFTAFSAKGMTAAQIQKILAAKPQLQRQCISAADLARSDWYVNEREPGCTYRDVSPPGRIVASAQCSSGRTQKISGSYTPTSFTVTAAGSSPAGAATLTFSGKRVGACAADDEE